MRGSVDRLAALMTRHRGVPGYGIAILVIGLVCAVDYLVHRLLRRARKVRGKHVVITGGSEGLGLALAVQMAAEGAARITLLARTEGKLRVAVDAVQSVERFSGSVAYRTCDVTDARQVESTMAGIERDLGPIDVLVCNAGTARPGYFVDAPINDFQDTMALNYFGAVHCTKAVVPRMAERRQGCVVLVASAMGVLGFSGYASYAPTKYALRGLGDTLRNELCATGVDVCVAFPVDIDTPGYRTENLTKPPCCREISAATAPSSAEAAARVLMRGFLSGLYHLPSTDLGTDLLAHSVGGVVPKRFPVIMDILLMPVMAVAQRAFRVFADGVVRKHRRGGK